MSILWNAFGHSWVAAGAAEAVLLLLPARPYRERFVAGVDRRPGKGDERVVVRRSVGERVDRHGHPFGTETKDLAPRERFEENSQALKPAFVPLFVLEQGSAIGRRLGFWLEETAGRCLPR